jgi:hypothetical protein
MTSCDGQQQSGARQKGDEGYAGYKNENDFHGSMSYCLGKPGFERILFFSKPGTCYT